MTERQYTYARNQLIEFGYLMDDTPETTKITFYINPSIYDNELDTSRVPSDSQLDTPRVPKLDTPRVPLSNTSPTNTILIEDPIESIKEEETKEEDDIMDYAPKRKSDSDSLSSYGYSLSFEEVFPK